MSFDPIVDEVQRIRQEQASRFDFDIEKIYQELVRLESQDKAPFLSPPKPPPPNPLQRTRVARR
jgi:hypothetical protein